MSSNVAQENVTDEPDGLVAVTTVTGDLDAGTAPAVYRQALKAISRSPLLVLDLTGTTFCDSSGFNALLRLRRRAEESGGQLALAAPPAQVTRLLTLTGGNVIFPVYSGVAEARAGLLSREGT
ncbi:MULTISPECIES: STAS domain-containing protein [unclassified Streptomyces]|uniref:STAS domain-containing protein n=1 Tax=unclassified Streptomyces TaxID=2593676 RepID=UPI00331A76E9